MVRHKSYIRGIYFHRDVKALVKIRINWISMPNFPNQHGSLITREQREKIAVRASLDIANSSSTKYPITHGWVPDDISLT